MRTKRSGGAAVKQFTFWARWKGGLQLGSPYLGALHSNSSLNGKGLHTMRGVYEKVKGSNDWYISYFDADGRHHREHVGRYSAAVEAYVNKKREIREGKFVPPTKRRQHGPTLQELFDMRLADMKRSLSVQTYGHLKNNFAHPQLAALKMRPAAQIRPKEIEDFLSKLHDEGKSPGTIRNYRAMLGAIFVYGIKHDHLVVNPKSKTLAPKMSRGRVRFFSSDEEASIRRVINNRFPTREAEFDLHLHTGLRTGEAYLLTWDRVHLDRAMVEVPENGKTGLRYIPINSVCRRALETLHAQSGGSEFVIPRCGKKNSAIDRWFRTACEAAGVLNASPHTLRHTFASRLVMAGVNIRRVQEFLGHATIAMTMKYAHLSPERGQEDIERLVQATAAPAAVPTPAKRPMRKAARASAETIADKPAKIASIA